MITSNGFRLSLSYDDKNRVSKMNESISGTGITNKQTEYNYNDTGIIKGVKTTQNNTALTTSYQFDDLYRMHISSLKLKAGETEQEVLQNTYHYREGELAGSTTNYVKQHVINDRTFDYTYDVRGNITQISFNGNVVATYTYDEFDQLISETKNGVTTTWTYDAGGNILTKSHGDTIIEYTYGDAEWKDKLSSYNGKIITYDEIGNPLTIGTDTTLTWEAGTILASITKAGVTTSFIYNADGYRTSKTSGGVTTTYYLDAGRISAMIKGTDELSFAHDENGAVIGLYHNGTAYAYAKNLQGDIKGWITAINLRAGDVLVLQNGKYIIVEKIQHEILETPITVYNFEVEDFHTYYVGENSILVHNTCQRFTPDQQAVIELARENRNGLSRSEAEILLGWAKEYGINTHGPMIHPNRSGIWSYTEHIKIFNEHIPIK